MDSPPGIPYSAKMTTILNVANRLPVTVGETIEKSAGGLVAALEGVTDNDLALKWLGWPGCPVDSSAEQRRLAATLSADYGYECVFLTEEEVNRYYHGFANSSLWPLFHYNPAYMRYDERDWKSYLAVNERFAARADELAAPDDLVWIHDYQLMLVPTLLRQRRPDLRIGFFLHTPFPSSEVFRCHPRRNELIEGVLGADQVGFHTFGYMRHFRSSALRILGLESDVGAIPQGNHTTHLAVYPIGINSESFRRTLASQEFRRQRDELAQSWAGKRMVLSVERLDYSKGIPERLQAIERFLEQQDGVEDLVFVLVNVPSRGEVREYQELRDLVEREVGRINGRFATTRNSPIHFIHHSVPFNELCALYSLADVCLVTPLVDGMNLVAKEYVACQSDQHPGVLVLSEFAGAAQELVNALIVNPFDIRQMADAITRALAMDLGDRRRRVAYLRDRVMRFDANHWAASFVQDLRNRAAAAEAPLQLERNAEPILHRLSEASSVALFLDYDGTLREFVGIPDQALPTPPIIECFETLAQAPADVFVLSGRDPETLDRWMKDYPFTLIAEHGNAFRPAGSETWESLNPAADFSWKEKILEIMRQTEGSTPGSIVEEKHSAVVWHYRQADPEFGKWKAHQLMADLYDMLANAPVEIHHGKRMVEVSSIHVNKGAAVQHFVGQRDYDFILCAGDDQTDENMFRLDRDDVVTIKVGEGETRAQFRVRDPAHFRALLLRVANVLGAGHTAAH